MHNLPPDALYLPEHDVVEVIGLEWAKEVRHRSR